MRKTKNINMKIGQVLYRGIETMDLDGLAKVRQAIYVELKRIESNLSGNARPQTQRLLETQAQIAYKRMQQVERYAQAIIRQAVPAIPKHLTDAAPDPSPTEP